MIATIKITDLRLRTITGIEDWERKAKQDVIINMEMDYDAKLSAQNDSIDHGVNYKTITKKVIKLVEESNYQLLETLVTEILKIMRENPLVKRAWVKVDKPFALRFSDSVSLQMTSGE
ncbi:MAG: dihydroneopterin triphosphate 2'-epimerase [SAR324 cluster bacterium]|uniref:Dihydroneopterin triphosphate 2'-epimerase n=1 Tax=SAR324 cluster bacterium TaxID=2024889 RepID=A0A2A4T6Q0_9DELT|nr:MAG: dihydroneopterin triphosphate 2'-epimerase [SAR324 cluster bacterium]